MKKPKTEVERTMTPADKLILQNQRMIMWALKGLAAKNGQMNIAHELHYLLYQFEEAYDWITPPSQRVGRP